MALQVVSPSSLGAAKVKEIERSDIPFLLPTLLHLQEYKERNEVAPPLMPRLHRQIPGTILLMTAPCRPLQPDGPSQHGPLEMEVTSRWVLSTAFCYSNNNNDNNQTSPLLEELPVSSIFPHSSLGGGKEILSLSGVLKTNCYGK